MQVARKVFRVQSMECSGLLATGHTSGCVYFWRNRVVVSVLQVSDCDPKLHVASKGCPSFVIESSAGIRCIRLWSMNDAWQDPNLPHKRMAESTAGQRWCLGFASQEGAVHIYGFSACDATAMQRREEENSEENVPEARRIVSLWLPRHMGGPTRSAIRTFDVNQRPCGPLNAVVGAYDGTIWMCCLDLESKWQVPPTCLFCADPFLILGICCQTGFSTIVLLYCTSEAVQFVSCMSLATYKVSWPTRPPAALSMCTYS